MKKQICITAVTLTASLMVSSVQASGQLVAPEVFAGDPPISGKMLGDNCSACHGTQGRLFDESMPPLAGMKAEVFIQLMQDFKHHKRPSIVMNHIAHVFSDEEIERMADYFESLPATPWRDENVMGETSCK